jgi:acyl-CoA synthetase (AMP-forming)/AMP-acid ligase II
MSHDFQSLVDMLRQRSKLAPSARAYTFLADGETESAALSYTELDRRARAIAAALVDRGVRPGDRAILLFPPGIDFIPAFFGALYAQVIAVPCYPPHPSQLARSLPRLCAIANDADPAVVLCPSELASLAPELARHSPPLGASQWLATDTIADDLASEWRDPHVASDALAFLQYTSGSTASPRGVMVSHGNLLHNLELANHAEANDEQSVSVSWLPVIHDMGLIEGVLEPIFGGYPAYLMSPASFLQRPIRWLRAITQYRATNSGAPNFAYDLCVRKITTAQKATLDLSSWRVAYNGAEPIRAHTITTFHDAFKECGFRLNAFYPVYGLAEATLAVSSGGRSYEPVLIEASMEELHEGRVSAVSSRRFARNTTLVASGPPALGTAVAIVDPHTRRRCNDGDVGEIWICSPSVAQGYWRRADDTSRVFRATIDGETSGPWLRSGDLGSMIDGELFVVGRIKDVLIVRGMKHFPQDLELTAERQHDAIRPGCTAAFAVEGPDGGPQIVVASEVDPRRLVEERMSRVLLFSQASDASLTPDARNAVVAVTRAVRHGIATEHGIQLHGVALLPPGRIPKTTSGKIRRHACADGWLEGSLQSIAQWRQPVAGSPDDFLLASSQ